MLKAREKSRNITENEYLLDNAKERNKTNYGTGNERRGEGDVTKKQIKFKMNMET